MFEGFFAPTTIDTDPGTCEFEMAPDLSLFIFIGLTFLAALSGAVFRPGPWYWQLDKPSWRPPDWLFAPVWFVLYAMIAVAGWAVWKVAGWSGGAVALTLWGLQLALNAVWSGLFFGLRRLDLATYEIAALWLSIVATIAAFWPISQGAALLMVPYLIWVSFAALLTLVIWRRNPRGHPHVKASAPQP